MVCGGQIRCVGHFDDPKEAALAYDKAVLEWRGEKAILNFPPGAHEEQHEQQPLQEEQHEGQHQQHQQQEQGPEKEPEDVEAVPLLHGSSPHLNGVCPHDVATHLFHRSSSGMSAAVHFGGCCASLTKLCLSPHFVRSTLLQGRRPRLKAPLRSS